ncbi:MAG: trypsin-like peptidase domain-containing protein [Thermoguttaceae bacterium]|nr:trypsin-like peptidase domain-containing protein [Thermoguttaceae bacterium]
MTRTARNRLFLALALGVAATFPRSLHPRPLSLGDAVAHAEFNRVNRNVSNELSPKNYNAPLYFTQLRETGIETDALSAPANAQTFDRFFLGDAANTLNPPSLNDLFSPDCPSGTCPFASVPARPLQTPPVPTAPDGVVRSVVRVYNAYEETISNADASLGPTRRRVVEKGSGAVVVDSVGTRYVLTAAHIFRDGRGQITAQTLDGRIFAASLALASEECDVALLRVDASQDVPALTISASWPRQGETVWRAGFGPNETLQELAGVVKGYVKTDRYSTYETLKIDGPARQGDSGGPVYNASGEIVGVVWGTDGSDAYATYCGRVLKTLCDYSPTFAHPPVQADAPSQPSFEENANEPLPIADALTNDSATTCEPESAPLNSVVETLAPTSKLRDFWNAALAFAVVLAFGYCGFFASKTR